MSDNYKNSFSYKNMTSNLTDDEITNMLTNYKIKVGSALALFVGFTQILMVKII